MFEENPKTNYDLEHFEIQGLFSLKLWLRDISELVNSKLCILLFWLVQKLRIFVIYSIYWRECEQKCYLSQLA